MSLPLPLSLSLSLIPTCLLWMMLKARGEGKNDPCYIYFFLFFSLLFSFSRDDPYDLCTHPSSTCWPPHPFPHPRYLFWLPLPPPYSLPLFLPFILSIIYTLPYLALPSFTYFRFLYVSIITPVFLHLIFPLPSPLPSPLLSPLSPPLNLVLSSFAKLHALPITYVLAFCWFFLTTGQIGLYWVSQQTCRRRRRRRRRKRKE